MSFCIRFYAGSTAFSFIIIILIKNKKTLSISLTYLSPCLTPDWGHSNIFYFHVLWLHYLRSPKYHHPLHILFPLSRCNLHAFEPLFLCFEWFVMRWGGGGGAYVEVISLLLFSAAQEELAILRRQLEGKDGEMRRLQDETGFKVITSSSTDISERGGEDSHIARYNLTSHI